MVITPLSKARCPSYYILAPHLRGSNLGLFRLCDFMRERRPPFLQLPSQRVARGSCQSFLTRPFLRERTCFGGPPSAIPSCTPRSVALLFFRISTSSFSLPLDESFTLLSPCRSFTEGRVSTHPFRCLLALIRLLFLWRVLRLYLTFFFKDCGTAFFRCSLCSPPCFFWLGPAGSAGPPMLLFLFCVCVV